MKKITNNMNWYCRG